MDEINNLLPDQDFVQISYNRSIVHEVNVTKIPMINDEISPPFNITDVLGPQRDSLMIVIPITIIYTLIFITGVIGNISTCIVIRKNRSMHTATNFYLFSLAISDFLLLLSGVPQEMYFIWSKYPYVFGEIFCIGRGFAAETSANATVLTITAFTAERYVAICHPFMSHAMSKLNRVTRIILIIWFASFVTAIPQAAQFGVANINGITYCMVVRRVVDHSFELSTFIFFFTPMSIILVLYLLIGLKLRKSNLLRPTNNDNILHRNACSLRSQSHQGTKRVIKMLVAVVLAFFICWAPFHAQRLIAIYGAESNLYNQKDPTMVTLYTVMTYISGVLYYLSTCINPFLYNIMSNKFREAFKDTLDQFNVCSSETSQPKRKYRVLSGTNRLRVAFQESIDYTSSSHREDSIQSTSSWKYTDSMTNGRQRGNAFHRDNTFRDHGNIGSNCETNYYDALPLRAKAIPKLDSCTSLEVGHLHHNHNQHYQNHQQQAVQHQQQNQHHSHDSIIEIDEIDLPSTDASLNVVYTKHGDIHIRLQKKRVKSNNGNSLTRLFVYVSRAFKSRPKAKHMGFYTPPIDENSSLYSMNINQDVLHKKLKDSSKYCDDISNSSLQNIDKEAMADELAEYLNNFQTSGYRG